MKHGVDDFAHVCRSRASATSCRRHEWQDQSRLRIRHIRWISQSFPAMPAPGNTSPCHHSPHLFARTDEPKQAGIVQKLSDWSLKFKKVRCIQVCDLFSFLRSDRCRSQELKGFSGGLKGVIDGKHDSILPNGHDCTDQGSMRKNAACCDKYISPEIR